MNTNLAPTYQKYFGNCWVLWYATSNSYSIVDAEFKSLLDLYLQSDSIDNFKSKITAIDSDSDFSVLKSTLQNYLDNCNKPSIPVLPNCIPLDTSFRRISKQYCIEGKTIQVHFDSELVSKLVHPSLAHYQTATNHKADTVFDIYLKDEELLLFKDERLITRTPKRDYHLIQGKFTMLLLCAIHHKEEQDWVGTFHGSTITDRHSSLLFVGESGKGKSTLCALLGANGFDLLADDVSPMLSEDGDIYYNPAAISIKEGAFKLLEPVVDNFEALPVVSFNKTKGDLKYMPGTRPINYHYPCHAVILVNYIKDSETTLKPESVKTLLETLIPDSWLSPNPKHAQQFLKWLEHIEIYTLTYSDTQSVSLEISKLFKTLNSAKPA